MTAAGRPISVGAAGRCRSGGVRPSGTGALRGRTRRPWRLRRRRPIPPP
jgi:hypothetical protein